YTSPKSNVSYNYSLFMHHFDRPGATGGLRLTTIRLPPIIGPPQPTAERGRGRDLKTRRGDCKRPAKALHWEHIMGRRMPRIAGLAMDALKKAYRSVTRQIEVKAAPRFLADRSSPENGYSFWAYTIMLPHLGRETVQL